MYQLKLLLLAGAFVLALAHNSPSPSCSTIYGTYGSGTTVCPPPLPPTTCISSYVYPRWGTPTYSSSCVYVVTDPPYTNPTYTPTYPPPTSYSIPTPPPYPPPPNFNTSYPPSSSYPSSSSSYHTSSSIIYHPPTPTKDHDRPGKIAGGVVGGFAGLALLAGLLFYYFRPRRPPYTPTYPAAAPEPGPSYGDAARAA